MGTPRRSCSWSARLSRRALASSSSSSPRRLTSGCHTSLSTSGCSEVLLRCTPKPGALKTSPLFLSSTRTAPVLSRRPVRRALPGRAGLRRPPLALGGRVLRGPDRGGGRHASAGERALRDWTLWAVRQLPEVQQEHDLGEHFEHPGRHTIRNGTCNVGGNCSEQPGEHS